MTRIGRIGWEISVSLVGRDTGARESVGVVVVLLLRFSDPGLQLVPYVHILHYKLSLIRSRHLQTQGDRDILSE